MDRSSPDVGVVVPILNGANGFDELKYDVSLYLQIQC